MRIAAALVGLVLAASPRSAAALGDLVGARAVGIGGGLRAAATGGAGPQLNPSGMSLLRSYAVEAAYQLGAHDSAHFAHASIVDSTSGFNLGGGVYYTFLHASPDGLPQRTGHEGGLALSFPFGDRFFLGGTLKYLHITDGVKESGITVDAGMTVRPAAPLALGVAAYNLRQLDTVEAPRGIGYGISFALGLDGLIAADGLTHFATGAGTKARTSIMGGVEYLFGRRVGVRGGGGWDAVRENGYVAAGLSGVSEDGAVEVGFRQDVSGSGKATFICAGLRLFVPTQ